MADEFDAPTLIAAALREDDEAARQLVRQLYPLVAKLVRAHRPARSTEEDLCQMIFVRMFRNLSQFSGAVPLEHWVSRIAITCLNQIAAEKARPELRRADLSDEQAAMIDNLAATSDDVAVQQQLAAREMVALLLDTLKPAERLVIDLMYLQQKSVAEIGEVTGWSRALVKVRAFRARQKLKARAARLRNQEENRYARF